MRRLKKIRKKTVDRQKETLRKQKLLKPPRIPISSVFNHPSQTSLNSVIDNAKNINVAHVIWTVGFVVLLWMGL